MGQTAEVLARDWGVSREEQDAFALRSHQRARRRGRRPDGREVVPVPIGPRYEAAADRDNGIREHQRRRPWPVSRPSSIEPTAR